MPTLIIVGGVVLLGLIAWGLWRLVRSKKAQRWASKVEDIKKVVEK